MKSMPVRVYIVIGGTLLFKCLYHQHGERACTKDKLHLCHSEVRHPSHNANELTSEESISC